MSAFARNMVVQLKETENDFEWYPSDQSMLDCIKADIEDDFRFDAPSILDCGAGDGRVLKALTTGKKYAIEKARPLLDVLDKDIFVVGTEFKENQIIDKRVNIIFSNPPYSEFIFWATKIIKEANAPLVYLILPTRWKDSALIQEALELREAKADLLGEFDFHNADRQARATVNVIKIQLGYSSRHNSISVKKDPFSIWFNEFFKADIDKKEQSKYDFENIKKANLKERLNNALVEGSNIISVLEALYRQDLERLIITYRNLSEVDRDILKELDVNIESVQKAMELRISGLKDRYWHELFNNLNTVTDKLTKASREKLLRTLTEHTHVDFSASNAHAIVGWVVRNANDYFNDQLIDTFERMTEKANVINYVSNQRTFGEDSWRYCRKPDDLNHYKLDYRIVLERTGGIDRSGWSYNSINGLSLRAADFINDLCTIATNLGFNTYGLERVVDFQWSSNQQKEFQFKDIHTGELHTLFTVRAFLNGNLHLKFNPKYMIRLSLEFGRLKGWLKSADQAASEMEIDIVDAQEGFGSNLQLTGKNLLALAFDEAA